MNKYFYLYVAEEDIHAVMIQMDQKDGTFAVRPVCGYYREQTARDTVDKYNEHLANRMLPRNERKSLPPIRINPPLEYRFIIPEWWSDRCPNWSHTEKVV